MDEELGAVIGTLECHVVLPSTDGAAEKSGDYQRRQMVGGDWRRSETSDGRG